MGGQESGKERNVIKQNNQSDILEKRLCDIQRASSMNLEPSKLPLLSAVELVMLYLGRLWTIILLFLCD